MKESKAMMRKEVGLMKKAGAPKSMIKHEKAEMRAAKPKKMMGGGIATNTKAPPAPNTPGSPSAFAKLSSAQQQAIQARGPSSAQQQDIQVRGLSSAQQQARLSSAQQQALKQDMAKSPSAFAKLSSAQQQAMKQEMAKKQAPMSPSAFAKLSSVQQQAMKQEMAKKQAMKPEMAKKQAIQARVSSQQQAGMKQEMAKKQAMKQEMDKKQARVSSQQQAAINKREVTKKFEEKTQRWRENNPDYKPGSLVGVPYVPDWVRGSAVKQEMDKKQAYAAGGRIASKGEHAVQRRAKRGAQMIKMARGGRYC